MKKGRKLSSKKPSKKKAQKKCRKAKSPNWGDMLKGGYADPRGGACFGQP